MEEIKDQCLIVSINHANDGEAGAQAYVSDKLTDVAVPSSANQAGGEVRCDRCFAVFRILPGGVYLEQQGLDCDEVEGAIGGPHDWQMNVRGPAYRL